jgi:DNA-binding NarL/FixJ family response regulator
MKQENDVTKILFIDDDEVSFQFRKCMAQVLGTLPPVELFHANDATEGLMMLDDVKPDVIVLDNEMPEECDLFLDNLSASHPPVIVQVEEQSKNSSKPQSNIVINYIQKNESLAGVHETLMAVTNIAAKGEVPPTADDMH